jgi:hypothetical protein
MHCGVDMVMTPQRKFKSLDHGLLNPQWLSDAISCLNQSRSSLTTALCSPSLATSTNQ